jgi:hypothetical protein
MIFGFNTDVKIGDVVYHVQSEARHKDLLLETQVFVKGRCIGKCATPYVEDRALESAEESLQYALRAQHRRIVDSLRQGTLEREMTLSPAVPSDSSGTPPPEAFVSPEPESAGPPRLEDLSGVSPETEFTAAPVLAAFPDGLSTGSFSIECLNSDSVLQAETILLVLQVAQDRQLLEGADLALRFVWGEAPSQYFYATTGSDGTAEVAIAVRSSATQEGRVLVQASCQGSSATRRFRLKSPV